MNHIKIRWMFSNFQIGAIKMWQLVHVAGCELWLTYTVDLRFESCVYRNKIYAMKIPIFATFQGVIYEIQMLSFII